MSGMAVTRIWYAALVDILRDQWRSPMRWEDLVTLRRRLEERLHVEREGRGLHGPELRCRRCGERQTARPAITLRALLLAAGRHGVEPRENIESLTEALAARRAQLRLDAFGEPEARGPRSRREASDASSIP